MWNSGGDYHISPSPLGYIVFRIVKSFLVVYVLAFEVWNTETLCGILYMKKKQRKEGKKIIHTTKNEYTCMYVRFSLSYSFYVLTKAYLVIIKSLLYSTLLYSTLLYSTLLYSTLLYFYFTLLYLIQIYLSIMWICW